MLNFLSFFFMMWSLTIIYILSFRCSIFWAFSLSNKKMRKIDENVSVSMLNVLSFFFIHKIKLLWFGGLSVSMLNVLSFFFIAHSTTAMNKHLLRGISEEISPCALFIHFYHYTMINKAVENCSEKILKLKIISPLSLYKYL